MKNVRFLFPTLFPLLLFTQNIHAQNNTIVKYYDSSWVTTAKDSSTYFTRFVKRGDVYNTYSYWTKSNKLNCVSTYIDTLFTKAIGFQRRYYETGKLQDSTYFHENGSVKNTFHYYPSGKLWAHFTMDENGKNQISEGYEENGKLIPNFIYEREAAFPSGNEAWIAYIQNNLKSNVPIKKGAPKGTYNVVVQFIIGKTGEISILKTETNMGYGMEEELIRVIKKSGKWIPAIQLGKPVNAYRRQPMTFVVSES